MVLTQKEIDALHIAGFLSVTELLARYFELQREVINYKRVNAIGTNKCQVNLYP